MTDGGLDTLLDISFATVRVMLHSSRTPARCHQLEKVRCILCSVVHGFFRSERSDMCLWTGKRKDEVGASLELRIGLYSALGSGLAVFSALLRHHCVRVRLKG